VWGSSWQDYTLPQIELDLWYWYIMKSALAYTESAYPRCPEWTGRPREFREWMG
jgi:hypothetical protein